MRRFVSIAITTFSYLFADNLCSVSDSMYGVIHVTRQQLRPMLLHQWVKNLPAHKVFHYQFELIVDEVRQSEDRIFYCTKFKWYFFANHWLKNIFTRFVSKEPVLYQQKVLRMKYICPLTVYSFIHFRSSGTFILFNPRTTFSASESNGDDLFKTNYFFDRCTR